MPARIFVFMLADVFDRVISSVLIPWNFGHAEYPNARHRGILPEIITNAQYKIIYLKINDYSKSINLGY